MILQNRGDVPADTKERDKARDALRNVLERRVKRSVKLGAYRAGKDSSGAWCWAIPGVEIRNPHTGDNLQKAIHRGKEFLTEYLANGMKSCRDVLDAAVANGITHGTLQQAAKALGIEPKQKAGRWY